MATPQSQPENSLQLRRTFAAPRERVYRAWTDAKEFALWFHPSSRPHHDCFATRFKSGREIQPGDAPQGRKCAQVERDLPTSETTREVGLHLALGH